MLDFFLGSSFSIWTAAETGSDARTLAETSGSCFPCFRHQRCHAPYQTCSWNWGVRRTLPGEIGHYARSARGSGSNVQRRYHSYCGVSELWPGQISTQVAGGFFLQCWIKKIVPFSFVQVIANTWFSGYVGTQITICYINWFRMIWNEG